MNQGSFLSYKEQVYNPGSPNPNPKSSPLKALPKEPNSPFFSTPDPENPLKLTLSCKRKRPDPNLSKSPSKKLKMATKEEMKEMHEDLIKRFLDAQTVSSKALCDEIKQEIKVDIGSINEKLDTLNDKQEALATEAKKDKEETEQKEEERRGKEKERKKRKKEKKKRKKKRKEEDDDEEEEEKEEEEGE